MKELAQPIAQRKNVSSTSSGAAGPKGVALAPPAYGIAFVDQAAKGVNRTGLPDQLKAGVESLSGLSLDSVRVHYNSSQPAQLNALAYTQGSEIHVGPGQERHLPHEAWHVVQQAQGRVRATTRMQGVGVNDDPQLEMEAENMGGRAMQGEAMAVKSTVPFPSKKNISPEIDRAIQYVCYSVQNNGNDHSGDTTPGAGFSASQKDDFFQIIGEEISIEPDVMGYDAITDNMLAKHRDVMPIIGHVDHIVPASLGGGAVNSNSRLINAKANIERKDDFEKHNGTWSKVDVIIVADNQNSYTTAWGAMKYGKASLDELQNLRSLFPSLWGQTKRFLMPRQ